MSEEKNIPEVQSTDNSSQSTEKNENISEENIQHLIPNPQHSIENMEVHKHPHHVTHKKKWTEYLLEFFMLAIQSTSMVPFTAYRLSKKFYGARNFFQNSGTLDQLKNSGGLRLINNRKIVDSIEAYDQQVRRMTKRDDFESEAFVYNSRLAQKLFDAGLV